MVRSEFAQKHGFSVNTQFTGHGIGRNFHLPPWILHARKLAYHQRTDESLTRCQRE